MAARPSPFTTATIGAVGLYAAFSLSYKLFDRVLPSRRDTPPQSAFGLVEVANIKSSNDSGKEIYLVFVHGLGSQPDTTWRAIKPSRLPPWSLRQWLHSLGTHAFAQISKKESVAWIEDLLPSDLKSQQYCENIRIFYYNYDSAYYRDASAKHLEDLGAQLLSKISSDFHASPVVSGILACTTVTLID